MKAGADKVDTAKRTLDAALKGESSATGDDDGVDRSEVIRRHLSAGAGTPRCTPET